VDHIGPQLAKIDQNIKLNTADPVARDGFTQLPNFILRNPAISIGAKTVYSLFISYAWHNNFCFPGQETLAKAIGMSVGSVNAFIKELEAVTASTATKDGNSPTRSTNDRATTSDRTHPRNRPHRHGGRRQHRVCG
jgi:hypothetical protein